MRYNGFSSKAHVTLRVGALKASQHPAKSGGHAHCRSDDKMVLVCDVISQDNFILFYFIYFFL